MRLLVITYRLPTDLCTGDKTTVHHLLKYLAPRHRISFLSFVTSSQEAGRTELVAPYCHRVELVHLPRWRSVVQSAAAIMSTRPVQVSYYRSAEMSRKVTSIMEQERIDVAYGYHVRTAQYLQQIHQRPTVLDLKPVQRLNLQRISRYVSGPLRRLFYSSEWRRMQKYEPHVARCTSRCLVSSERDREALDPAGRWGNLMVNPHGLDTDYFAPLIHAAKVPGRLVFSGNMNYEPNVDAILYFVQQVYPLLRQMRPHVSLTIAGKNPRAKIVSLGREPSIEVTGFVPDMRTHLHQAEVAINPLRMGAGLQNKVLEAMSMGLPIVMSTVANEGIQAVHDVHALMADGPQATARQIVRLLDDPLLRDRLGRSARRWIMANWSWETHFRPLESTLQELADGSARLDAAGARSRPRQLPRVLR